MSKAQTSLPTSGPQRMSAPQAADNDSTPDLAGEGALQGAGAMQQEAAPGGYSLLAQSDSQQGRRSLFRR